MSFPRSRFTVVCPRCLQNSGRPNGRRKTVVKGLMQQVRCIECRRQWSFPFDGIDLPFGGRRVRIPVDKILTGAALLVTGTPLARIERFLHVKSETLRRYLEDLMRNGHWFWVEENLKHYSVPTEDLVNFALGVENWLQQQPTAAPFFRIWGQDIRRRNGPERTEAKRLALRILNKARTRSAAGSKQRDFGVTE